MQVALTTSPWVILPVALQVPTEVLFLKMVSVIVSPVVSAGRIPLVVSAYISIVVRLQAIGIGAPRAGSSFDAVEL